MSLRIVTWNCCRGRAEEKIALLDHFKYDIAVLQECAELPQIVGKQFWRGDSARQGVAVIARGNYSIRTEPELDGVLPYFIPFRVTGPTEFLMFAVWSKNHPRAQYVRSVVRAIRIYQSLIQDSECVIVGDLNTNAFWNASHPRYENHAAMVELLGELGLKSCYHAYRNESHGEETIPSFYLTWNEAKPYHLDFCFAPESWLSEIDEVQLPLFHTRWSRSDHRPLLVSFRNPQDNDSQPTCTS